MGCARYRSAFGYLGAVLAWALAIRFQYPFLIAHPGLTRSLAALTVGLAAVALVGEWSEWSFPVAREAEQAVTISD